MGITAPVLVLLMLVVISGSFAEEVPKETEGGQPSMADDRIKCRVCLAAMDDLWHRGSELNGQCMQKRQYHVKTELLKRREENQRREARGQDLLDELREKHIPMVRDHDCSGYNVAIDRVKRLVHKTCSQLPSGHDVHHDHPNGGDTHPNGVATGFKLVSVRNRTVDTTSRVPDADFDRLQAEKKAHLEAEQKAADIRTREQAGSETAPQQQDSSSSPSMASSSPLVAHSTPGTHTEDTVKAIEAACAKWLYQEHTEDKIAAMVQSHVASGAPRSHGLPHLRKRFCYSACSKGTRFKHEREAPKHDYHDEL